MFLAIDVGNSNIVLGLYRDAALLRHWRLRTDPGRPPDEYVLLLRGLLELGGQGDGKGDRSIFAEIHSRSAVGLRENRSVPFSVTAARGREFQAAIASVVPAMTEIMVETCRRALGCEAFVIRPGITTGMRLGYDDPRQLGADRLANAVAAYERVGDAVIVVDAGTATKVEYVSRAGTFEGGVIAPGPGIAGEALFERAARLSRVELVRPATVIGRTTPAAVQSGLVHGFAALVDGLVRRLWREAGPTGAVLATGGFAGLLATAAETITAIHPFLTLDGVRILYDRNCSTTRDGRLHG